jgi:hypothetical protein
MALLCRIAYLTNCSPVWVVSIYWTRKLENQVLFFKVHFHSGESSTDRKFSENIIVKSWKFPTSKLFPTENLCRPITFYKFFFPRKIFLSGNGPFRAIRETCYNIYFISSAWNIYFQVMHFDVLCYIYVSHI